MPFCLFDFPKLVPLFGDTPPQTGRATPVLAYFALISMLHSPAKPKDI